MEITRDIIQLIFTPIMLLIIFGYQFFKIKNLKGQLAGHDKILNSIQTYFKILNPELLKYRVEMYENILEKEKKIALEKAQSNLLKAIDGMKTTQTAALKSVASALRAMFESFLLIPHNERIRIVDKVEDEVLRHAIEAELPSYKEFDEEINKKMMIHFLSGKSSDS